MSKVLTEAQRQRKNELARQRRALKTVEVIEAPTIEVEAVQTKPKVLEGEPIVTKFLGEGRVQKVFARAGGVFVTTDGNGVYAGSCKHTTEELAEKGAIVLWEQVGAGNRDWEDGAHGSAHRFARCNKIVAVLP